MMTAQPDDVEERAIVQRWIDSIGSPGPTSRARPVDAFADVVASALDQPRRLAAALRRFGRRLAVEGWTLAELSAWIETLAVLEPAIGSRLDRFRLGLALADGWVDGARVPGGDRDCRDPLTGLATTGVLRMRLEQVYDHCHSLDLACHEAYRLVVVDTAAAGEPPFVRNATMMVVAEQLRATFVAGETLCAAGSGRMVVLAATNPMLAAEVDRFVETLRATPLLTHVPVLAWLEALPAGRADLPAFLADLLG